MKSGRVKLVIKAQTSPFREIRPHVSKMTNFTCNWVSRIFIKNALVLNFIHHIINLLDTEVVICIILFYKQVIFMVYLSFRDNLL